MEVIGLALGQIASNGLRLGISYLGLALCVWVLCNAAALGLLYFGLFRLSPLPQYSIRTSVRTLLLGSACVIALSNALTPGGARPAFGTLTMLLLTVPYPLVYLLLEARRRTPMIVTAGMALALTVAAVPLRDAQEHLVVQDWLSAHHGTDSALLDTVTWPDTAPGTSLATGPYGIRTTVTYPGDNSAHGGTVTVSPAATDPCTTFAQLATYDGRATHTVATGTTVTVKPRTCAPTSANTWTLTNGAWTGYAVRRDGVLLTLTFDSPLHTPDLPAIARSLHPMSDGDLWPGMQADSGAPLLLR